MEGKSEVFTGRPISHSFLPHMEILVLLFFSVPLIVYTQQCKDNGSVVRKLGIDLESFFDI